MEVQDVEMNRPNMFSSQEGVVVRQVTQLMESVAQTVGLPYEARNKYKVSFLPGGKNVAQTPKDPQRWQPTSTELEALEQALFVREESGLLMRCLTAICGVLNLRPLTLHFSVDPTSGDAYIVNRPFNCGAWICCPLTMDLLENSPQGAFKIGRVIENWDNYCLRCCQVCCLATVYHDVQVIENAVYRTKYTIRANVACCGRVNNCCGATCCKNDMVWDILDPQGSIVATIQKTYGPGSGACCRCCYMFNNYILKFPTAASGTERALLLATLFQIDYHLFEKKGND